MNHRSKGYDILAITDHNRLATWAPDNVDGGKSMIGIPFGIEQSIANHVNSFWADFRNVRGQRTADILADVERAGGISFIAHPGAYMEAFKSVSSSPTGTRDAAGLRDSRKHRYIPRYVNFFKTLPSCVGMEIVNALDWISSVDRALWDEILKQTMPEHPVWGFATDDSHTLDAIGYAWNMMLMPELTQRATRNAMKSGTFYAVSRVSRVDFINRTIYSDGKHTNMPGVGDRRTLYLLEQETPSISNIEVGNNYITITGDNYATIEWIANGEIIALGETLTLTDHQSEMNYVRAQLKSDTGIAFTQPFGIIKLSD
ncbi:MAG: hypothetical protein FWD25_05310 [Clostridia bacterium]|nr:hypothetical protein [Clostridia bacterium]